MRQLQEDINNQNEKDVLLLSNSFLGVYNTLFLR